MLLDQMLIIVVLYNPKINDLERVVNNLKFNLELLVIDNSQTSYENYFVEFSRIKYKHFPENIGLADAYNYGIDYCIVKQKKFMWIMDQDSDFSNINISEMEFILSDKININNCAIFALKPVRDKNQLSIIRHPEITADEAVLSSGSIINIDIAQKLGKFDSRLFIDAVDCEYAFRVLENCYKILCFNNLTFIHNIGEPKKIKYAGRNMIAYNHKPIRGYYMVRNNLLMQEIYKNSGNHYIIKTLESSLNTWVFERIRLISHEEERLLKYYYCFLGKYHYQNRCFGCIPEEYVVSSDKDIVKVLLHNQDFLKYFLESLVDLELILNKEINLLNGLTINTRIGIKLLGFMKKIKNKCLKIMCV